MGESAEVFNIIIPPMKLSLSRLKNAISFPFEPNECHLQFINKVVKFFTVLATTKNSNNEIFSLKQG